MRIPFPSFLWGVRVPTVALTLLLCVAARADFESDAQKPLRLIEAQQFKQALVALGDIAPRYPNEFALHYMTGLARMGGLDEKGKVTDVIQQMQQARASLVRALQLAKNNEQKKEARELLKVVEAGLKELGAPLQAAATPKNQDAEIAELKRRLAELEGKPAPAKPASSTKPQAAPVTQIGPPDLPATLPKLSLLKPSPRTAKGRVVNRMGKPLAGVEVRVSGTTLAGERTAFYPKTNAQGVYSTPVPDGIYTTRVELPRDYNGARFTSILHPIDGDHDSPQDSRKGVVEDYVWRLSGLKPGESEDATKPWVYYGGQIQAGVADLGSYGVINDTVAAKELAEFPDGFRLDVTFTPQGALLDGGPGRAFSFSKTYKPVGPLSPYGNVSFELLDVPSGRYTVTARLTKPDGTARDLMVTARRYQPLQTPALAQTLDFEQSSPLDTRRAFVQIYVWPNPAQ